MTSEELNAMQDELARTIRQQAEAALEQALQLMSEGMAPREALAQVTQTFTGQYYEALSSAFTRVLGDYVGIADIKALNISGIDLSDALYTHIQRTNLTAQQVINDHMKGFVQARKLAMDLYEGYGFKDDPLKVKAKLPKYLRQALKDPAIDDGYRRLLAQIRTNQIKTPALKAGYQQLLDGLENGVGQASLKNLLKTAWFERNRYFANRIAQTETSRAYMNGVAQELMADDQVVWVQYEMSRTHPRVDICDRHAKLNAYGQGPGIYPKAQAPKPPAHPFCRCKITPRYDVEAEPGKPIINAERSFMAGLDSRDQRLIAGSRAKLDAFNKGKTLESIYNGSAKPMYRWGRLGDGVDLTQSQPVPSSPINQPTAPVTPSDFIAAGNRITSALPAGDTDPQACFDGIMNLLKSEVGISTPAKIASSGAGARLVREASMRYPDSWTQAADAFGPLYTKTSVKTRGHHLTITTPPSNGGTRYRLKDFGIVNYEQNAGYLMARTGDVGNAVHEFAHRLQSAMPELDDLFQKVHRQRTGNDPLERLKDLQPTRDYDITEVTRKDKYTNPYQGKEYSAGAPGGAREVMTMALENVLGFGTGESAWAVERRQKEFVKMYREDRNMFDFVVGLLRHWQP